MSTTPAVEISGLVKRYGPATAVDGLSLTARRGEVTAILGPNGAGKTTTMRCILGLDYPTEGTVKVDGKSYDDLAYPMREVGALLEAKAVHGGRSVYNHLLCLAQTNSLPKRRVNEVLELVGLTEVASKRSKGFSLGMSQRLGEGGEHPADELQPLRPGVEGLPGRRVQEGGQLGRERAEHGGGVLVGPVAAVGGEQRPQAGDQRPEGQLLPDVDRRPGEDEGPVGLGVLHQPTQQPALARPGLAAQQPRRGLSGPDPPPGLEQVVELGTAPRFPVRHATIRHGEKR